MKIMVAERRCVSSYENHYVNSGRRRVQMQKISLMLGVLLALLAHAAMAEEEGQKIAHACAADFERLCAGRVPMPRIEDFQKSGHAYTCLQEYVASGQLSQPCWYVIMGGSR